MRFLVLALGLLLASASSHALYRCEINGKIEYRDLPCPAGKASEIRVDPMRPTEEDAAYARNKASREVERTRVYRPRDEDQALRTRASMETRTTQMRERRASVRCDQMLRSAKLAADKAKTNNDAESVNHATNLRQNYELECTVDRRK